ncbi:beta-lactamase-like protein [Lactarius quietus]|nr:beta-lactamase-like protein [Lactarius quietus]
MTDITSSLSLPASKGSTVRVSVMNVGSLVVPSSAMVQPQIHGHEAMKLPFYSFLVENEKVGKKVLFDLGIMKTWKEKLPQFLRQIQSAGATIDAPADVCDILKAASVPLSSIDFAIWSHHHADHTGDLTLFPPSTSLVVGPGFKSHPLTYPGYPVNPKAQTRHEAFEGRELIELDFSGSASTLKVAGLRAIDWFDDGSFYLLEAPGHTADHIMALARTSADKFVLLAGDDAHHCGEFRPSPLTPLPDSISPSPFEHPTSASVCPCSLFERIHPSPESFRTAPFYEAAAPLVDDPVAHRTTIEAIKMLDASPDVFVIIAHDASLLDVLGFFPTADLAGWEMRPSKKDVSQWRFLNDFRKGALGEQAALVVKHGTNSASGGYASCSHTAKQGVCVK